MHLQMDPLSEYQEQDKSSNIKKQPPLGNRKLSNTLPPMGGGGGGCLQNQQEHHIIYQESLLSRIIESTSIVGWWLGINWSKCQINLVHAKACGGMNKLIWQEG